MHARGLCGNCYKVEHRQGTLEQWPTTVTRRSRVEVVENVTWLAETGTPPEQWPRRLVMTSAALERALQRSGRHDLARQVSRFRNQERRN